MNQIDLRPFLQSMGGQLTRAALDVPERLAPEDPAELLEDDIVEVATSPADPDKSAFVDGIQSASVLTYRHHRPVTLVMAGAGAVTGSLTPAHNKELIELFTARADEEWLRDKNCPVPLRVISEEDDPTAVERAIGGTLGEERDQLEILLTAELSQSSGWDLIAVDGGLASRPHDDRVVGIIKTTNTRLLSDESVLWGLPEGYRSPAFELPKNYGGPDSAPRMSAYVRLRNASQSAWNTGLIRVEGYSIDALNTAAATALAHRQPSATRDPRGDRHVMPVAQVEKWMRARRPSYL